MKDKIDTLTTIIIKKSTRETLKKLGKKGDTYDEVINKLILKVK